MTGISGIGSGADYTTTTQSSSSVAGGSGSNTISLGTSTIDFALSGSTTTEVNTDANHLFSVLDTDVLGSEYRGGSNNLAAVGGAIDTYTSSLSSSNVYDSSYTTPSSQFLSDLTALKTAAASGNLQEAQTELAQAKLAAPDDVASGAAAAISHGDAAGEAALTVEGTANISDYLATQGYSSAGAEAEASAVTINGLSEYAADTSTSTPQTRTQQINDLAESTANAPLTSSSNPLLNIISDLLAARSGTAIDQSLINLDALYGKSTQGTGS